MEIVYYEDKYLDSLNVLLKEVFDVLKVSKKKSDDIELLCVSKDTVVGYLALNRCQNSLTGEAYFYVNYVCVKEEYRGQGIATMMFDKVFEISKDMGISYLELTSSPKRVSAHALYKKVGFDVRETTVFRKVLG